VRPNPRAQPPRLANQLLARHGFEILVHGASLPAAASGRCARVGLSNYGYWAR
jgi:hypothetical protein